MILLFVFLTNTLTTAPRKYVYFQMWEKSLCSFGQQFCFETFQSILFLLSLFITVESWTLTVTEVSGNCSALDVDLGSFMTSWMSQRSIDSHFARYFVFLVH